ncbi:Small ribosomal subunit biogenesis GTPase RsgA [Mesoplasma sp. JKS002658]|uniref:ribosome small subunit-dependent GTPase A n=1 Tax=Mesoplasma whartonense TaxID=2878854 RepID=UPI002022A17C|nr:MULTISPECIES: ribosome small subunit-dependent GTPase A [unclassified Mesoplasma]MCL8211508.1 Small ribosomal subunit biogenesis GTPase RsgA [Mesoplasma sp. JKS002664]MCL8211968.1 Small ribosomal subunit biogenesis GTPase RsgA [Mesoplasma sp. JKS002662]MCL8213588.1 Small ribosomal subunit biogenesis GTPase RsgA [Mesoplasma sp. JKS002660]MCL8213927.1 Small ribosomal subunit biogenesis GTPase RsgA [Mesoplasma sp. JKS002658]MCL8214893.1 Small ribosomal subunit biogenesis GTPase RsgA [Mesoplasm
MIKKEKGMILDIDSDQSEVFAFDRQEIISCYAKGNLKKLTKTFYVGDLVMFEHLNDQSGYITKIFPRKNTLFRPKIANIDNVLLVNALKEPSLNTFLLDKYLAFLEVYQIEPLLVFTKKDLLTNDDLIFTKVKAYQEMGYTTFLLNNNSPDKKVLGEIEKIMENKLSVFVGQTGAGKTSTLNNFLSFENQQRTNSISKALNRGKHTTTKIRIYVINQVIFLADSPGFSAFDLKGISLAELRSAFRIFEKYQGECKFNDCLHLSEKGCMIKKKVETQDIPLFFYEDYIKIAEEVQKEESSWQKL